MRRVWVGFKKFALPQFLARCGIDPLSGLNSLASQPETNNGAYLVKLKGTGTAADPDQTLHTVQAGGLHYGVVEPTLLEPFVIPIDPKNNQSAGEELIATWSSISEPG
jgi:hypothetical protein